MVETHLQKSRRVAKEAQDSANMSGYEYDNNIFFNFDRNTLLDIDNYRNMENIENTNNTNNNDAQEENVDNALVHTTYVEEVIIDPKFHRMVQEIMKRDRQYFLQVMAQSGVKIPHDFDMSQIVDNQPTHRNQANMDQRRPNSGGNRRSHVMPESPSSSFQKPEVSHTYATQERTSHEHFHQHKPS